LVVPKGQTLSYFKPADRVSRVTKEFSYRNPRARKVILSFVHESLSPITGAAFSGTSLKQLDASNRFHNALADRILEDGKFIADLCAHPQTSVRAYGELMELASALEAKTRGEWRQSRPLPNAVLLGNYLRPTLQRAIAAQKKELALHDSWIKQASQLLD